MPRTFHERELVISNRAHLPTWLPRTQRSRLVPAAMLESRMSVGTQRGRHAIALKVPLKTSPDIFHLGKLSLTWRTLMEKPSRSPFQCPPANHQRISSSAWNPLLADGSVISDGNIRCTSTDIHYRTTRTLRGLRPYHFLSIFRVHVNTYTLHAISAE